MIINGYIPTSYINPQIEQTGVNNVSKNNDRADVGFGELLRNNLDKVNDAQIKADETTTNFINGEEKDIHNVMISNEEAKISLQMAVEVRNKLVEAYQELMRMQL